MSVRPLSTRRTTLGLSDALGVAARALHVSRRTPVVAAAKAGTADGKAATNTGGRTRRLLTSVLVALGIGLGGVAVTAAPAEAASYVTGCFRSDRAGIGVASLPVQLQAYWNGSWYTISSQQLPQSQCVAWNISTSHRGYYLRMLVNYQAYGAWWYGQTPLWANPGNQAVNLGTGTVTCRGCAF